MPFSDTGRNTMLSSFVAAYPWLSLHSAYSTSGANEMTGGSPAYARQQAVFDSPSGGAIAITGTETFDVATSSTVAFFGAWSASTAGNFAGMFPLQAGTPKAFTAATSDTITAPAHGLSDTNTVVVWASAGGTLPTGLTAGTIYYIRDSATDTFKLAASSGGAAIDLTAAGAGVMQTITVFTYSAQGTLALSDPSAGSMFTVV